MRFDDYDYLFDIERCPYKDVCSLKDTKYCNQGCIRYMEMDFLLYMSYLPESKRFPQILIPEEIDLDSFRRLKNVKDDIINFVESGSSLYIYSTTPGNGKTSWAIKLLLKYFDCVWSGNGFKPRGLFINVPNFLRQITENISNPSQEFAELRKLITTVDLVVWDDIGATKLSDYDHKNLLSFVDQRILANKANIYTGNLPEENLIDAIGLRLASRVYNESSVVELRGADRRGYIYD